MDAACPVENGQPLALAGDFGGSNARWPVEVQCVYDNADHTYNLNAGKIESFNYYELRAYPVAQVLAARVYYTQNPNVGAQSAVESYSGGVLTLANKSAVPATTIYKNRVSVRNIPYAIQRGQWAYIVQPGGLQVVDGAAAHDPVDSAFVAQRRMFLAEQPQQNQALLELFHACLSLGLTGELRGAPEAAQQLEKLRTRVFLTLPQPGEAALSPPWQAAVRPSRPLWQRRRRRLPPAIQRRRRCARVQQASV